QPRGQFPRLARARRPFRRRHHHRRLVAFSARRTRAGTRLKPVEIAFTPVNNQRLANLCGALDENLRQIETALDVNIARRGEKFSVSGPAPRTKIASQVLKSFYERSGHELSLEDIQLGLIEATGAAKSKPPSGSPALVTRREDLHGRTPRQVQYI